MRFKISGFSDEISSEIITQFEILNKLKNCNPNEVGKVLKEYFNYKKKNKKT